MLSAITGFFQSHFAAQDEEQKTHSVDQIQLASAALMIELCKADRNIDDTETNTLVEILRNRFDLEESDLQELIQLAEQEAKESTSLYQFTSLMNEHFEYGEKVMLIQNMWEVAYADGHIDRYEEHLIRKIADLLYLSHVDFIKTKSIARDNTGTSSSE